MKRSEIISTRVLNSLRPYLAALIMVLCLGGIWGAARAGLSRLFTNSSKRTGSLEFGDRAVQLGKSDPDAHFALGMLLSGKGDFGEGIRELELAAALRPKDYYLWVELGEQREHSGDKPGALAAYEESVRRAPYYANPRWYLGNLYLREGRTTEAFVELRRAYGSDPSLLPNVIDLAWKIYSGDSAAARAAISPEDASDRLVLETFFLEQGQPAEAVKTFSEVKNPPEWERLELLRRLLEAKKFTEGFQVWATGHKGSEAGAVVNGDFEGRVPRDELGFGWQFSSHMPTVQPMLDPTDARSGSQSLCLQYQGNSEAPMAAVSQLVVVEPKTRYRLTFAGRTKDLVTGGPPLVMVVDAADDRELGKSTSFPRGTDGWHDYAVEFVTQDKTSAIRIQIQRESCEAPDCPIFGSAWFDTFVLQKSSGEAPSR